LKTDTSKTKTAIPAEIFKAYDIRGIIGKTLTNTIAEQIGHALGSEAQARNVKTLVVGRDGRLSGPELVEALCRGLNKAGCDVIDIGQVPTPVLYFATHKLGTHSGVSVTGSHNPPDYNGFKMMLAGETLSGETIQQLHQRLVSGDLSSGSGTVKQADVREQYFDRITSDISLKRELDVIVDCGNGVAGDWAPELLRRLGCKTEEMYCEVDGNFPNHHPDPSQPKNLVELIDKVKAKPGSIGLAFDGDGDRLGVISPSGEIIWPDRQMNLYARDVLSRNPGAQIIYDIKCSRTLHKAIEEAGGKPLMWKTGHSLIKAKIKETGALLAGEMSGHIFFKERWYGFDDGLYTAARLLEILAKDIRSPEEIFGALPNTINTPELQIKLSEGENHAMIKKLVTAAHFPDAQITTIDGLRVDFDEGWGLVRASNTTPVLVLRFEATNQATLENIQDQFRRLIEEVKPGLKIPF